MSLTYERASFLFDYDEGTGIIVWRNPTSNRVRAGHVAGVVTKKCIEIKVDGAPQKAHRIAWLLSNGEWPPTIIDHINGDPLDNRIENLRLATQRQNLGNTRMSKCNKSGVKGVHWDAARNKWQAQISINNHSTSLGRFTDIRDAQMAYAKSANEQFGDFARLK